MHRLIMNSETYKLASSYAQTANLEKDPTNIHLWRFPLRRLEAEAIRDVILSAAAGLRSAPWRNEPKTLPTPAAAAPTPIAARPAPMTWADAKSMMSSFAK